MSKLIAVFFLFTATDNKPNGDTHFGNAMQLAESCITYFQEQAAIIFLSDGQSKDSKGEKDDLDEKAGRDNIIASDRLKRLKKKCRSFEFYPIEFGAYTWTKWWVGTEALKAMAKAAGATVVNVRGGTNDNNNINNDKSDDDSKTNEALIAKKALTVVTLDEHLKIVANKIADTSFLVHEQA